MQDMKSEGSQSLWCAWIGSLQRLTSKNHHYCNNKWNRSLVFPQEAAHCLLYSHCCQGCKVFQEFSISKQFINSCTSNTFCFDPNFNYQIYVAWIQPLRSIQSSLKGEISKDTLMRSWTWPSNEAANKNILACSGLLSISTCITAINKSAKIFVCLSNLLCLQGAQREQTSFSPNHIICCCQASFGAGLSDVCLHKSATTTVPHSHVQNSSTVYMSTQHKGSHLAPVAAGCAASPV